MNAVLIGHLSELGRKKEKKKLKFHDQLSTRTRKLLYNYIFIT
jgi:hypothetical protein